MTMACIGRAHCGVKDALVGCVPSPDSLYATEGEQCRVQVMLDNEHCHHYCALCATACSEQEHMTSHVRPDHRTLRFLAVLLWIEGAVTDRGRPAVDCIQCD